VIGNFSAFQGVSKATRQELFQGYSSAWQKEDCWKRSPAILDGLNGETTFAEELPFTVLE